MLSLETVATLIAVGATIIGGIAAFIGLVRKQARASVLAELKIQDVERALRDGLQAMEDRLTGYATHDNLRESEDRSKATSPHIVVNELRNSVAGQIASLHERLNRELKDLQGQRENVLDRVSELVAQIEVLADGTARLEDARARLEMTLTTVAGASSQDAVRVKALEAFKDACEHTLMHLRERLAKLETLSERKRT